MAATLLAPAVLQAVMLLWPDIIAAQYAGATMSCALAAAIVLVPALLQSLLYRDHLGLPP